MLLSDDELTMMQALADERGLSASDLIRTQLRENFARFAKEQDESVAEALRGARARATIKEFDDLTREQRAALVLLANATRPMPSDRVALLLRVPRTQALLALEALSHRRLIEPSPDGEPEAWIASALGRAVSRTFRE